MTDDLIDLNETTIRDDLDEYTTNDVRVTLSGVFDDDSRRNLNYEQGNGDRRSITLWENSTPAAVYETQFAPGVTYVFTDIQYKTNDYNGQTYHNLNATSSTTVQNARAYDGVVDDDADTFAGGEPVDAHIDDGLPDAETPNESATTDGQSTGLSGAFENDSGHVATSVVSQSALPAYACYRYDLTVTGADAPVSKAARQKQVYDARRRLYAASDAAVIATDHRNLQLLTLTALDEGALTLGEMELSRAGEDTLDYEVRGDRAIAEEFVEEAYKTSLREEWTVRGIDEILDPVPVKETTGFALHECYDCSVEVGHTGLVYLHVNFRHRRLPSLTLANLDADDVYPGLRVNTTYKPYSGYWVAGWGDAGTMEPLTRLQNRSVVEYHREQQTVPDPDLDAIERANNRIVNAHYMGSGGDEAAAFPPELLVVQGSNAQLRRFTDGDFAKDVFAHEKLSATRCAAKAREFIKTNDTFALGGFHVSFEESLFGGNDEQHVVQLYDADEEVLTFADGKTGSHPKETFDHGIAHPPESFDVTLVRPEKRKAHSDAGWQALVDILADAGAKPTRVATVEYDPFDPPANIGLDVGAAVDSDASDAVLVVLPPDRHMDGLADADVVYNEVKETLANSGVYSQMAHIDNFDGTQSFLTRNIALGLLATAGGVPFTVEGSLPGNADMFIGVDVSRRYPDESSADQISVSATTTAIYKDGTILGHSSTTPQLGETLSPQATRGIMRDALLGYKTRHGSNPEHIVIHRDGFMHEDLTLALELLDDLDISYDIVEVRKTPQTRLLRKSDAQFEVPMKSVAIINQNEPRATVATFGAPENLATGGATGLPRPIQLTRVAGDTDIETLARQVYLLSQSHVGVHNSTTRLPITTLFADKASSAATRGHLVQTGAFEPNLGFI